MLNFGNCRSCYYICISNVCCDGHTNLLDAIVIKRRAGRLYEFEQLQWDDVCYLNKCTKVCNERSVNDCNVNYCRPKVCDNCPTLQWSQYLEQLCGCTRQHQVVTLRLNTQFTAALVIALNRCPAVILRFASFCWSKFQINLMSGIAVGIFVRQPRKLFLDYHWNARLLSLILRQMALDDAMNWLNTLGGGYSALGDYFEVHAAEAGKISMKQLQLAMEMGDEPTVIRCHLYCALSLMQRGYFIAAKHLIREQYAAAKRLLVRDSRLLNMCQGLWAKLKHTMHMRRQLKLQNCHSYHSTLVPSTFTRDQLIAL